MTDSTNTQYEETEAPRDVAIERSKRELYEELRTTDSSPFYEVELRELFLFAMGYGRQKAGRVELDGDLHYLFGRTTLSDEQEWIIKSVAVKETREPDVLRDKRMIYTIAQEYANTGIEKLHGRVFGPDEALNELTSELKSFHETED
jgi:site-specific DNA-adenine methylase